MALQKIHDPTKNDYWVDLPDPSTPIVEVELNRIEKNLDEIDDRVIMIYNTKANQSDLAQTNSNVTSLGITKANQSDLLQSIKTVSYTKGTGTFTFTFWNGNTIVIDTDIEKIPVNFDYDDDPTSAHYQNLIIRLDDGTVKYVDLSALITQYSFVNSTTIRFTLRNNGEVTADIIDGSITAAKLQPNYLADITTQADRATASATASANSATASASSATLSQSWAEGGTGTRVDENKRNAKAYSDKAEAIVSQMLGSLGIGVSGTKLSFGASFPFDLTVTGTKLVISERI